MENQVENQQENQSSILGEEEVQLLFAEDTEEAPEVVLPSEEANDEYANLSKEELVEMLKAKATTPTTEEEVPVVPATIVEDFTTKYNNNGGKFTEEDYADLAKKGFSKDFVDTYVEGQKAKELSYYENIVKPYGSMEDYAEATVYAQANWSEAQVKAYNDALSKADESTTTILVSALMKEFNSSKKGATPNGPITNTRQPQPKAITGYETKSDMTKDMNDPRYGKDASYTKKVEDKLLATDMGSWYAGVYRGD